MDKPDDDGRVPVDDRPAETEPTPGVIAAREEADAVAERIGSDIDPTLDAVLENCRIARSQPSTRIWPTTPTWT